MHRFYLPPEQCNSSQLILTSGEAHHAIQVLRLRVGERVSVLDGAGRDFVCAVKRTGRHEVHLDIAERNVSETPKHQITLLQAIPKGKLFEAIIQKATEMGAFEIIPLLSERVAIRLDSTSAQQKREKWQSVAIEAIKQCGSPWLPKVNTPVMPAEFLNAKRLFDLSLVASLRTNSKHARVHFSSYQNQHDRKPATLSIWIGPEGDFTPEEVDAIEASGALPITLGPLVLRSETAATCALSNLNYELASLFPGRD